MGPHLCAIPLLRLTPEFLVAAGVTVLLAVGTRWFIGRHAPGRRLGWPVVALLAVTLCLGLVHSNQSAHQARETIREIVRGMAPSYAQGMAVRNLASVTVDTPPDDPTYLALIQMQRRWLELNPAVADIYTVTRTGPGRYALLVDSETDYDHNGVIEGEREERTPIGELYEADDDSLGRAFEGESFFADEVIHDRWGTWVSAYEPIRDGSGTVVGVLGVDFPAERWEEATSRAQWGSLAQVGVVALVILGVHALRATHGAAIGRERDEAREARELKAEAEEKSKAKGEFLAHMSHELRTPMTAIQGFASLLADSEYPASQRPEAARIIRSQCEHLLGIVGDVLDLSKVEAGRMELCPGEVPLLEFLGDTLGAMKPRAEGKGLTLQMRVEYPVPERIVTDPVRLRQVLMNVLGNAVKFTERGGVTLGVSYDRAGERLCLEVEDTGIGMSPDQLHRVFTPYAQASASTSSKFGGTGLGLSIARRLAELLGGGVTMSSELGKGTRTRIVLRASNAGGGWVQGESRIGTAGAQLPRADTPGLRGRVLLAEDGPDTQRLVGFILRRAGAEVEIVGDGLKAVSSALEAAKGGRPFDLVLMDLGLPEMDGMTALRTLRERGYSGRVCAFTASGLAEVRTKCLEAGFDGVVSKLIDRDELVARCAALLASASAKAA